MVDLGVDLDGEEDGAEAVAVVLVGVADGAGAVGKKTEDKRRTVDCIMHSICKLTRAAPTILTTSFRSCIANQI